MFLIRWYTIIDDINSERLAYSLTEELLTTEEVAEGLHVHPQTVRNLLANGEMAGVKVARQWLISRDALAEYLARKRAESGVRAQSGPRGAGGDIWTAEREERPVRSRAERPLSIWDGARPPAMPAKR